MANKDDNLPAWDDPNDPRVCFCWKVHRAELQRLIGEGARTLDELAAATRAGTGCGTCRSDLLRLLRDTITAAATATPDTRGSRF